MKNIDSLLALIRQKQEAFRCYEAATQEMLSCSADQLPEKIALREKQIAQIDLLDSAIAHTISEMGEQGSRISSVLKLREERSTLLPELLPLFDAALVIRSVVCRIERLDMLVADRIEEELEFLTEKIKENNRGAGAQASKYLVMADLGSQGGLLDGRKVKA